MNTKARLGHEEKASERYHAELSCGLWALHPSGWPVSLKLEGMGWTMIRSFVLLITTQYVTLGFFRRAVACQYISVESHCASLSKFSVR